MSIRRQCFDRSLYVPYPSYSSMVQLWMDIVHECLRTVDAKLPSDFDFSSLAHISKGFSCGAIVRAIKATLTGRRLYRVRGWNCVYVVLNVSLSFVFQLLVSCRRCGVVCWEHILCDASIVLDYPSA